MPLKYHFKSLAPQVKQIETTQDFGISMTGKNMGKNKMMQASHSGQRLKLKIRSYGIC